MSWDKAARSQLENNPPARGARKPSYMLNNPEMTSLLTRERIAQLEALGFVQCLIHGGERITLPLTDCVKYPNGTYEPQIEFLIAKLGGETLTKLIKEQGFNFKDSKSLAGFRSWRSELVKKVIENGKKETLI